MKFVRDYLNPDTGLIERVEMRRNKQGEYVFHDLRLPSKLRKKRIYQKRVRLDEEAEALVLSGHYAGRCVRPGVKGAKANEFCGLRVER